MATGPDAGPSGGAAAGPGAPGRRAAAAGLAVAVLAAAALLAGQAWAQARQVQAHLTAARDLLARAGALDGGTLAQRTALLDQADAQVGAARRELGGWPLGPLGALPLAGRDVRVARAVA